MPSGTEGDDNLQNDPNIKNEAIDALGGNDRITLVPPDDAASATTTVNGGGGFDTLAITLATRQPGRTASGWTWDAQWWTLAGLRDGKIFGVVNRLLLAASCGALCATGPAAHAGSAQSPATPPPARSDADRYRAEQQRYEQGVREAEAARLRYEAEQARYEEARRRNEAEVARANARRADYDRRMAEREAERAERAERRAGRREAEASAAPASADRCEERQQRSRRRGRAIGGVLGGVAGGLAGRGAGRVAAIALGAPVGALIGEGIARLLDCDEQLQAAAATEEAVRGGVGTTTNWVSETRPNVAGSSTVTALDTAGGDECMTVTDVVIVDGEETRAPKRMCRRPPSNRYVRV